MKEEESEREEYVGGWYSADPIRWARAVQPEIRQDERRNGLRGVDGTI